MLQKENNFKIIEILRKEPSHIRLIASKLNLIPSTVMRILKNLEKENIVDYKTIGKNKTYFLKNTPESKSYEHISELYKLIKISKKPIIRRIIKELKNNTNGELIILFGSYAKGEEREKSDIDIYIESVDRKLKKNLLKISEKLSIKIGKLHKENLLTKEIIKNHVIIQNIERFFKITE